MKINNKVTITDTYYIVIKEYLKFLPFCGNTIYVHIAEIWCGPYNRFWFTDQRLLNNG